MNIRPFNHAVCMLPTGDKPELLYPEAASELAAAGYATTLDYVEAAAAAVLRETGLMPHINAGVMGAQDIAR
jgi:FO synthase